MTIVQNRPSTGDFSPSKAWSRALQLTAPISEHRDRVFPAVVQELAERYGDAPALLSDRESFTYSHLCGRSNQYARWAIDQGLVKGDVVCLLMPNRPEYLAFWLGMNSVGVIVALLNTNLSGPSLAHCINVVEPKHIVVSDELISQLNSALPDVAAPASVWIHGASRQPFRRIDGEIDRYPVARLNEAEQRLLNIDDQALYIYTSGTTGWPKAAIVSHARVMQWSHWFAGMMDARPSDRMYDCLPMYHSVGGVLAPGAILVGGGALVVRETFSASRFWSDVVRWDCTLIQYIGELCRYLLHVPTTEIETQHRVRMACGNGLAQDVWGRFQERFKIPRIFEFYAATEGGVSLFNIEGEVGSIGRIPPYLAHRFSPSLVRFDAEKDGPVRNEKGFCIRCDTNEVGEAIARASYDRSNLGGRFEGYTSKEASEKKILRNVLESGDAWVRTGDLMRKDANGFFYFVDRVGDTFRWKGENVSTSEVSEVIRVFPGVKQANVYGVAIPRTEGRAGMAAVVPEDDLNLSAFRADLMNRLPAYACPVFLRIRNEMDLTTTFKYTKAELIREGYNPLSTADPIYFNHPDRKAFVRLDQSLYEQIAAGQIRL